MKVLVKEIQTNKVINGRTFKKAWVVMNEAGEKLSKVEFISEEEANMFAESKGTLVEAIELLEKVAILKSTGTKFIVTSLHGEGKVGVKRINPCNGTYRKNAKEVIFQIEKLEFLN